MQNGGTQSSQLAIKKAIFWSNKKADEMEKYYFALKCQRPVYLRVFVLDFICPLQMKMLCLTSYQKYIIYFRNNLCCK